MSILAYVGLPGSGKSYDVVANQILPALKQDRTVVTNIPLNESAIRETITTGTLIDFPTEQVQGAPEVIWEYAQPGVVLILDEVWRLFPAGLQANKVPEPFKKLLAEHRHMVDIKGDSMQIVLVTQDLAQISAFARQLIEQTVYHTKLSSVGLSKSYRIDIYNGPVTGANPNKQNRVREIFGKYENKITRLYTSHTMAQGKTDSINESGADDRGQVWKKPMLWISLAACIGVLIWGVPVVKRSFGGDKDFSDPAQAQKRTSPAPSAVSPNPSVARVGASASDGHHPAYPLSCTQHITEADVDCSCRDEYGIEVVTGYQCVTYMQGRVGGFGGPTAKSENIQYLNSQRGQAVTESTG